MILHRMSRLTNEHGKATAELQGRLQSMRIVHSAALASNDLDGERVSRKGRQMLYYESMKSA